MEIIAFRIIDRIKESGFTQSVLSKYSSVITTRLGFHEVTDALCSREATIILHLKDDVPELYEELVSIGGMIVRKNVFHDSFKVGGLDDSVRDKDTPGDILVVVVEKGHNAVEEVQAILTSYGCNIRTRLGLSLDKGRGLIILELVGDSKQRLLLENDLGCVDSVTSRKVVF